MKASTFFMLLRGRRIKCIEIRKTRKPVEHAEYRGYRVFRDARHIKHMKQHWYGCAWKAASYNGNSILFQFVAKRWRAESNLPGLTLLIPVSHLPLTALNHAWQHKAPSLSDTHRAAGKTNTCAQDSVIGERKRLERAQVKSLKSEAGRFGCCCHLPFSLGCCHFKAACPARAYIHIYMYIHTHLWAVAFSGLGDAVLMFGTRGALEVPSFIEMRWATARRRGFFLFSGNQMVSISTGSWGGTKHPKASRRVEEQTLEQISVCSWANKLTQLIL